MSAVYEIGPFRLDAAAKVMTHAGAPVALGPRAVAVLSLLVESAPEYVLKTRLIDAAWAGVVVEEANLAVQISAVRRVLAQTPGGEHWIETLARRGYRFVGPVTERRDTLVRGAASQRSNLPEATTSFVGRERELVEIKRALPRSRLLTLIGAGGIGKTRLALRVATEVMDAYADGVWLVGVAPLEDPNLVAQTVASVFGLKEQLGKSFTQTLTEHLKSRQLLLVLDNAEHLRATCSQLADAILPHCPHVVMLVTSREPLGLAGEPTYRVPSLSTPDSQRDATAESVAPYESVRLFIERARLNLPHFTVTNENAPALAAVCQQLDGIPLAIELAAARMRSLSVAEINQHLDERFRLLTGGSRTAVRRQQTLRAAIDWSYDLLSDAEKALLGRVSIFAGGWMLDAAEKVCAGDGIDAWEVTDLLTSLTDKSLVVAEEEDGATRYRLLETMRQYAREKLQESDAKARWQSQHLAYFMAFAEEAEPALRGADQQAWLDRLETEHDNLRAALAWSSTPDGDSSSGLRLAGALFQFWYVRGHLHEGRGWLSALLDRAVGAPAVLRAKALHGAGILAFGQADHTAAQMLAKGSLAIWRELGDRRGISSALDRLASVDYARGDYPSAKALHEEGLAIMRQLDDWRGVSTALNNLGNVACQQRDFRAARALYEESLAISYMRGDRGGIARKLHNLGTVANELGEYHDARRLYEESLAIGRELGNRHLIAHSLVSLAQVATNQGDCRAARAHYEESLPIFRKLGDQRNIARSLRELATLAFRLARPRQAACISGATERLQEELGYPMPPLERPNFDRQVAEARATMSDDAAFDLAWQDGRAMTLEQAIEYALKETDA